MFQKTPSDGREHFLLLIQGGVGREPWAPLTQEKHNEALKRQLWQSSKAWFDRTTSQGAYHSKSVTVLQIQQNTPTKEPGLCFIQHVFPPKHVDMPKSLPVSLSYKLKHHIWGHVPRSLPWLNPCCAVTRVTKFTPSLFFFKYTTDKHRNKKKECQQYRTVPSWIKRSPVSMKVGKLETV